MTTATATPSESEGALAATLVEAHRTATPVADLPATLVPADADAAFRVQWAVLSLKRQPAAGWKVGSKSPTGPVQGAPLPKDGVLASPAELPLGGRRLGLELELAFRIGRAFAPADEPYTDADVLAAVSEVCATIEVLSSRYAAWPEVDKFAQLADLQNHGALIVGEGVPYDAALRVLQVPARFSLDGVDIRSGDLDNPAGDPRRLLAWAVNHCTMAGRTFEAGTLITTGSYTGVHFAEAPGGVVGRIAGLPPVQLTLT